MTSPWCCGSGATRPPLMMTSPHDRARRRADRPSHSNGPDANPTDAASGPATVSPPSVTSAALAHGPGSGGGTAAETIWLQHEIDRQLKAYRRRRRRDKRKSFGLQMATVTLSATITVLLGLR